MDAGGSELVRQAIGGDSVALKLLLIEEHARLCTYVARRVPPVLAYAVDAEDIVQETQVEIFRRIGSFQPRLPDSFNRWATAIALSRLRNAIKKYRSLKRGGDHKRRASAVNLEESSVALLDLLAGPGKTPSRVVSRQEAVAAVQAAIGALPEPHRQAVWLVHIAGQSVRDTAHAMGCTERAVHGLCRRGLKQLEKRFVEEGPFLSSTG
jgi:RNA polymerase sigma-70 factor (ECF subfamily)